MNAYGNNELVAIDVSNLTWTVVGSTIFTRAAGSRFHNRFWALLILPVAFFMEAIALSITS